MGIDYHQAVLGNRRQEGLIGKQNCNLDLRHAEKEVKLLEIVDFEIGIMDGKPGTAALGQSLGGVHANFGMLETDAKYEDIRKKAVELIKRRHSKS